jgi:hypothetical protein
MPQTLSDGRVESEGRQANVGKERHAMTVEPLILIYGEKPVIQGEGDIVQKTFKNEDIEQIMTEADELLKQTDSRIKETQVCGSSQDREGRNTGERSLR